MRNSNKSNKTLKPKKDRIWELDFVRGFCVLLMIFDHTMYDLSSYAYQWFTSTGKEIFYTLYELSYSYYYELELRLFVEPLIVVIFCIVCGISCSFSRNNFKRGCELAICAILITIVTTIIDSPITFGIFHMFTIAIFTWCIIDILCRKNKIKTAFVCGIVGIAIVTINYILCSIWKTNPAAFVDNNKWFFIGDFMRGDPYTVIRNYDDQPIFPLVGYMLIGAAIGPILYMNKKSVLPHLGKYDWYAPVNFWGKYAMWVYILHQVVIAGIFAFISLFITGQFLMP